MKPRDLHFATFHQAAHVVVALVLGCRIEYVEIDAGSPKIGWDLGSASLTDTEAICGAGFQMEQMLGRRRDFSWSLSEDDRALLGSIHTDRTGLTLTQSEIGVRFAAGATASQDIIDHPSARHAIDALAEHLSEAYLRDVKRIEASDVKVITSLITGAAV